MADKKGRGQAPQWSLPSLLDLLPTGRLPLQKLAVTGGIASGKSTVVAILAAQGLKTISADEVALEIRQDPLLMTQLGQMLNLKGAATKDHLRSALLDQDKRRIINSFFHGQVWQAIAASSAQAVEVPLLVESCLWPLFQVTWSVSCPSEERVRRLVERGLTPDRALHLISIQVQDETRRALCDLEINSHQPMEGLKSEVISAFHRLPQGIAPQNRL